MKSIVYELSSSRVLNQNNVDVSEDSLKPESILADTIYSAISTGTEVAAWMGKAPLRPGNIYPRLVGYCNLAQVIKTGALVTGLKEGDYILTHQSHRSAFICNQSEILYTFSDSDNLSELQKKKVTAAYLYHLGYSALLAGQFMPGHQVAVIGAGTLGLTTSSLLKTFGCFPLLFTNQHLGDSVVAKIGGAKIFKKDMASTDGIKELENLGGADLVINTSNTWSDYFLSLKLARKGGKVVCLGFPGRDGDQLLSNPLDSKYFYDKQLTIQHCGHVADMDAQPIDIRFTLKRNISYIISLILHELLDPMEILVDELSWSELPKAYQILESRKQGIYSMLLNWKK